MENLIFTLVERGFGWNLVRNIFATLDNVAFFLFSKVMGLLFDIANLTAQKGDAITTFLEPLQGRIYVVLSIYMVFKVTISLLTYIVNPDAMTDKNQGAGKLVQRIIVSLAILSFFPYGFKMLNQLQADIIGNETIPKLVLGVSGSVDSPEGIGTEIAYEVYNGTFVSEGGGKVSTSPETVDEIVKNINEPADGDNSQYKYEYIPFAGFAVGMLLTVLTLSMCIDVAVRVFKLIILQMVAPIPIISYMDPKQAKDGAFSKWIKLTIKTWAEVFIRLFVIYFILLVIEELIGNGGALVSDTNLFVKIALVIGLLFFAKDAPKFICEAIGIKDVPKGGLFGGLGSIMAAGALGVGTLGTGIAVGRSTVANGEGGKFRNLLGGVAAGVGASAAGLRAGIMATGTAKDHQMKAAIDAINKNKSLALSRSESGSTLGGRLMAGAATAFGLDTAFDKMDTKIQDYESAEKAWKRIGAAMNSDTDKFYSFGSDFNASNGETLIRAGQNYSTKDMNDMLERMKSSGQYRQTEIESVDSMLKEVQKAKFDSVRNTSNPDSLSGTESQIYAAADTIYKVGKKYANDSDQVFSSYGSATSVADPSLNMGRDFKGASFNASRSADKIKNSPKYKQAKANKNEAQKK